MEKLVSILQTTTSRTIYVVINLNLRNRTMSVEIRQKQCNGQQVKHNERLFFFVKIKPKNRVNELFIIMCFFTRVFV